MPTIECHCPNCDQRFTRIVMRGGRRLAEVPPTQGPQALFKGIAATAEPQDAIPGGEDLRVTKG
jgi:hypothetical protein